jgi:hypothetical protein
MLQTQGDTKMIPLEQQTIRIVTGADCFFGWDE